MMDFATREQIFSKEAITIDDLANLMSLSYSAAAAEMRKIKHRQRLVGRLRFDVTGKLLLADYFDYYKIDPNVRRYYPQEEEL